ncbi:hypothetical protein LINPERPRIM_LOCUS33918 [Linum perenne]
MSSNGFPNIVSGFLTVLWAAAAEAPGRFRTAADAVGGGVGRRWEVCSHWKLIQAWWKKKQQCMVLCCCNIPFFFFLSRDWNQNGGFGI